MVKLRLLSLVLAGFCGVGIAHAHADDVAKAATAPNSAAPSNESSQARAALIQQWSVDRKPDALLQAKQQPTSGASDPGASFADTLRQIQVQVQTSDWAGVQATLAGMPADEAEALYLKILAACGSPASEPIGGMDATAAALASQTGAQLPAGVRVVAGAGVSPAAGRSSRSAASAAAASLADQYRLKPLLTAQELIPLLHCSPELPIPERLVPAVSGVIGAYLARGGDLDELLKECRTDFRNSTPALTPTSLAAVLVNLGNIDAAEEFLPSLETVIASNDPSALMLLAKHREARYDQIQDLSQLQQAWKMISGLVIDPEIAPLSREIQSKALDLIIKLPKEEGDAWLVMMIESHPQTVSQMLANIGSRTLRGLDELPTDAQRRLVQLRQLNRLVNAIVESSPGFATMHAGEISMTAAAWLREAEFSFANDQSSSKVPLAKTDAWGNLYYEDNYARPQQETRPVTHVPIATAELLKLVPQQNWQQLVESGLVARLPDVTARLAIKVGDFDQAAQAITDLAALKPKLATERANDFLRAWATWHDGTSGGQVRNRLQYSLSYQAQTGSGGIPLTRSKQNRNLAELQKWIELFNRLPMERPDQSLIVKAFVQCHGEAEVYRAEAIASVFGAVDQLQPVSVAELAQAMRSHLAGTWRKPTVQEQNRTNRKAIDIEKEVKRGYAEIGAFVSEQLGRHPNSWQLLLVYAALRHDEVEFLKLIEEKGQYAERRKEAFADFERAAQLYAKEVSQSKTSKETNEAFDFWFAASLGACDLSQLKEIADPFGHQTMKIRETILAMPDEVADRHLERFANQLFVNLSQLSSDVKFSYLKSGFDIVKDHPAAKDARESFDYYTDLVNEVRLVSAVDGSTVVGHAEPFGIFVNILHTLEIERESGGFEKYFKTPEKYRTAATLIDYRERFEEAVRQQFHEHFDVISVTIHQPGVSSRTAEEAGWRITPYAYLLLKAKGPQVDTVPPVSMTFDFNDNASEKSFRYGTISLPIQSNAVLIDARAEKAPLRPFQNLTVKQTVDERQASEGILAVEISATANGLVPPLEQLLSFENPGFTLSELDDRGMFVSKFQNESSEISVESERQWLATFKPSSPAAIPKSFKLGTPKLAGVSVLLQRYDDADLVASPATITLPGALKPWKSWPLLTGLIVLTLFAGCGIVFWQAHRQPLLADVAFENIDVVPARLTPFTAAGYVQSLLQKSMLTDSQRWQLQSTLGAIEESCFRNESTSETDLKELCERSRTIVHIPSTGS